MSALSSQHALRPGDSGRRGDSDGEVGGCRCRRITEAGDAEPVNTACWEAAQSAGEEGALRGAAGQHEERGGGT